MSVVFTLILLLSMLISFSWMSRGRRLFVYIFFSEEEFFAFSRFFGEFWYENLVFFFSEVLIEFTNFWWFLDECFCSKGIYMSIKSLVTIDYCIIYLLKLCKVDLQSIFVFNEDLVIDISIVSNFLSYGFINSFLNSYLTTFPFYAFNYFWSSSLSFCSCYISISYFWISI